METVGEVFVKFVKERRNKEKTRLHKEESKKYSGRETQILISCGKLLQKIG